jgi:hypothetical protein
MDWRSLAGFAAVLALLFAAAKVMNAAAQIQTENVAQLVSRRWSLVFDRYCELWIVRDSWTGEDLAWNAQPGRAIRMAIEGIRSIEVCNPECPRHGGFE